MPINAKCPECENRFQLQDDLLGQSMRCPKCRTIFTVKDVAQVQTLPATRVEPLPPVEVPARPRTDAPPTQSRSGNISDFVPVLSAGTAPKPVAPAPPPREVKWTEVDKAPPTLPKPKTGVVEKPWAPEMDGPAKKTGVVVDAYEPFAPQESTARKARRKSGRRILAGLIVFVIVGLSAGGYFLYRYIALGPERTLAAAHGLYKESRYDQARKIFEKLIHDYPDDSRVPEAKFFAEVSAVRHESSSVLNRSDPAPAVKQWKQMMEALNDPTVAPFADKKRFGIDISDAGTKLLEDLLGKAKDVFDRDKPEASQQWLDEAAAVDVAVDKFRPDEAGKPESIAKDFVTLRKQVDDAKAQLALLDEAKKILADPDDDKVVLAKRFAAARGLSTDDRFNKLLDQAEKQIQGKAVYAKQDPPVKPTAIPDDGLTSLLFAPSLYRGNVPIRGQPQVFFALARGVMYALSEANGTVLWAARTGIDCNITPVRVPASDQNPDMVLLASSLGGKHGLSARHPNDGRPLWHQELPAECKGPPVVFGAEAYVALNDGVGTVLQINIATGELVGKITLGRPLGTAMALRPQTGLLYAPAEARAVYVFDLDKRGPNGERLDPTFLGVMATSHAPGTLRSAPVFANPDPDATGPKYLVLSQVDGTDAMKLRVFEMLFSADGKVDNSGTPTDIALNGWASFAPYCDGEMLAVVTDQGSFGLYGLSLAGNRDAAIFNFPEQLGRTAPPTATARGQIVHAVEGGYWVVARGQLHRFRFGVNGENGLRFVPFGGAVPVGDPLQPAQVSPSGEVLVVVTQEGQTCRATAIDAHSSEVLWRRELGLMVKGNPLPSGTAALLLDQAGGMYRVETAKLAERGNAAWLVDERWLLAPPANGFTAVTDLIPGPNDSAYAVMLGGTEAQRRFLVRRYNGGRVDDVQVPAPALLAGTPVLSGDCLLMPLANGSLYRVNFADNKGLEEGPTWRGERLPANSVCHVVAINPTTCVTSDGSKALKRWNWAPGSKVFELEGRLDKLSDKVAALQSVPGGRAFLLADAKGNTTFWDAEKFKFPPLRAWRPNAKGPIPLGNVNSYWQAPGADGTMLYHIASQLVALDPNNNDARWISEPLGQLVEDPPISTATEIYVSERNGNVRTLDLQTGKFTMKKFTLPANYSFASSAVPVGKHLLIPLSDGTILFGEMK